MLRHKTLPYKLIQRRGAVSKNEKSDTQTTISHFLQKFKTRPTDLLLLDKPTRQAMQIYCNNEACSRNHCCRENAISIKYYISKHAHTHTHIYMCVCVCVCVYYCLSYPACKSHLFCAVLRHLWSVKLYNIFPLDLTNGKIFEKSY
jgi:hypothetical protein